MKYIAIFILKPIIYLANIILMFEIIYFTLKYLDYVINNPIYLLLMIGVMIISLILTDIFNHFLKLL